MTTIIAGKRKIQDGQRFNSLFPLPQKSDPILNSNGNVDDTLRLIAQIVKDYNWQTAKLAKVLKGNSVQETCQNIWSFTYNHLQYAPDKLGVEQLRTPARSWADRFKGVDCDCMAIYISSLLVNCGIDYQYRITKYSSDEFEHIYTIVPINNQTVIILDPVLNRYNFEKEYSAKKDFSMSGMPIQMLNGITEDAVMQSKSVLLTQVKASPIKMNLKISDDEQLKVLVNYLYLINQKIAAIRKAQGLNGNVEDVTPSSLIATGSAMQLVPVLNTLGALIVLGATVWMIIRLLRKKKVAAEPAGSISASVPINLNQLSNEEYYTSAGNAIIASYKIKPQTSDLMLAGIGAGETISTKDAGAIAEAGAALVKAFDSVKDLFGNKKSTDGTGEATHQIVNYFWGWGATANPNFNQTEAGVPNPLKYKIGQRAYITGTGTAYDGQNYLISEIWLSGHADGHGSLRLDTPYKLDRSKPFELYKGDITNVAPGTPGGGTPKQAGMFDFFTANPAAAGIGIVAAGILLFMAFGGSKPTGGSSGATRTRRTLNKSVKKVALK